MTNQEIPEEAVEAAAIEWVGKQVWQDCDHAWRADYLARARAILEAAAPHMLAEAWERGESAGYSQGRQWPDMNKVNNPYRPTK